ncbi:MAG: gfo/Idh/MocA family oxidoreductase [Betaproteobacteria bacterium]|nr:gfo/Idh/MocA family oxidoreductase [Betaproteobacteria bacterium]
MSPCRCAVIGVGYLGRFHAQKYAQLPAAELVAVVDADFARAEEVAAEFPGCKALRSPHELHEIIDAVSIAVPTQLHFATAKPFLEKGIHVLLEKPMTVTIKEAEILNQIATMSGSIFQIGHLERFNPAFLAFREHPVNPVFIESHRLAPYKPRGADVNVVLDLMIHDVDIILHMVNSDITSIAASGAKILSPTLDIVNARIEFRNGCVANVTASRVSQKTERKMRIFADQSYHTLDFQERRLRRYRLSEKEQLPGIPEIASEEFSFEQSDALKIEIESFLRAIRGESSVPVTGSDGQRALEAAIAITERVHDRLDAREKFKPGFRGEAN